MQNPKIIDNDRRLFLDVFNGIASKYTELSIATGYWDLLGTELVIEQLKKYKKIRLLIGREPLIPRHKIVDPEVDYPDADIFSDLENLIPDPKLKQTIIEIKALIQQGILEVKVYRKTFLHAKCYIFGDYDSDETVGIIGSSNFTRNGLVNNTELNALESDHRIVTFQPKTEKQEVGHLYWFDQFWNSEYVEDWKGKFVELLEESPVGDVLFSPYETYIKTLYELYKEELDEIDLGEDKNTFYELFEFQKRNVQHLLRKLEKYGTAMLCDSVGLGKTITAIEVIKQYTDSDIGRKRVVVVCPKSLKKQWNAELAKSGLPNLQSTVLQNMQAIEDGKEIDQIASVSLFVIDESHNLRKTSGSRYAALLDWIRNNKKAHVLMLTATPINNELHDLSNQILLGTRGFGDVVKITTVDSSTGLSGTKDFVKAVEDLQKKIKKQMNQGQNIDYEEIKRVMGPIIRSIVVRRTRQGIEKEYGYLIIDGREKKFPKAHPENYTYELPKDLVKKILSIKEKDLNLKEIYLKDPEEISEKCTLLKHPLDQLYLLDKEKLETTLEDESPIYFVFQLILMLGFVPYRWRIYLTEYYGKTTEQIREMRLPGDKSRELQQQRGIYGMFRTMFLKRMESSVMAITISLNKYFEKLKLFEKGLKRNKIVGIKDIEALKVALENTDEDCLLDELDEENPEETLVLDSVDDKKYMLKELKNDINREYELIDLLLKQLKHFEKDDSKLIALVKLVKKLQKEKPAGEKVLVFSYFADTVEYIKSNINKMSNNLLNETNTAFVSTKNRKDADILSKRFSPKSKDFTPNEEETELNYLFSTDILSEGQNLQDCGVIVNYDLHWNPVRMIQRNGRINRLGSDYENVYVYNMSPLAQLESYLRLVKRLESKISMISSTIGSDQSVLGEAENPVEFIETIRDLYSEDAEKRYKAMEEAEKSADFLVVEDDFVLDLKSFDRSDKHDVEYKKKIYGIAKGKWALMPEDENVKFKPQIMALTNLYQGSNMLVPEFITMNRTGGDRGAISTLEALQILRTDVRQNKRKHDNISCDKGKTKAIVEQPSSYVLEDEEEQTPTGQKLELLKIMRELHYSPDDIDTVRKSYMTKNVLDKKEIDLLIRRIVKARNENKPCQDNLKKIVSKANEITNEKEERVKPDRAENILCYVNENN